MKIVYFDCNNLIGSDKLILKKRYPTEFKTIEKYAPGRAPHWKKVISFNLIIRLQKSIDN